MAKRLVWTLTATFVRDAARARAPLDVAVEDAGVPLRIEDL